VPVVATHYNIQPVFEVFAAVQGRDLGGVSGEIDASWPKPERSPRGSSIVVRGQVQSMNSSFAGLAGGLCLRGAAGLSAVVVNFQSWLDPFIILTALPGALAGILWMLYVTQTTTVCGPDGSIMCVGVPPQQHPDDHVRQRPAPSGHDSRSAALTPA